MPSPQGDAGRRSATMRDVATTAGVAISTVSRVVNGKPGVAPDLDPVRERDLLKILTTRRVDGLIVVPTGQTDTELDAARRGGTPVVCVDRPTTAQQVDTVTVDNRAGVRAAVNRLHAAGHRRIAFLADLPAIWTAEVRHADLLEPGVSVIAQDQSAIGREAAALLFDRIDGEQGPARHRVLPTRYLACGSGEIPAVASI